MPDNKNQNKNAIKAYKDSIRQAESGGNDSAKANTSSATGRYQFTEATWKEMEKKLGRKLDIFKAEDQEAAMDKLTEINVNALNKNNIPVTPANLYMTHFLGVTGGTKFLKNLQDNPNELASKYVNQSAVKANNNLFFKGDKPVTAAELYNTMSAKVGENNQPINIQPKEYTETPIYRQTEIDNTSTNIPRIDPSLQRGKQVTPKQVTDNNNIKLNPVENTRNQLGLSSTLDFLPSDINLAFSQEDQLSEELDNPDEIINIARDGGKQDINISNKKTLSEGLLNEFNEGDSHENNKYGGIPQGIGENGKLNTVEEGETKFNNYVFSDTLKINDNDIESLFLPKELKGMTFSEASKYINDVLKDNPNDNIIKKTVNKQLDALTLGNEKARLAKEELDVNLNPASLIEDDTNLTEPNQMFLGGFGNVSGMLGNQGTMSNEDITEDLASKYNNENKSETNYSGLMQGAGAGLNAIGEGDFADRYNYNPELKANYQQLEKAKDGISSAIPVFGGFFRGVEKAGKGIGTAIGGETGGDVASGILDPFSGQMETLKNKDSTQFEKGLSLAAPFLSGVIASKGRKRSQAKLDTQNAIAQGNQYNNDFKVGGDLNDPKYIPTSEDELDFQGLDLTKFNQDSLNNIQNPTDWYSSNPPFMSLSRENIIAPTNEDNKKENIYKAKQKSMLQYAPVLGDFLNYQDARKDKPEVERLNRLDSRFNSNYVDESYLQNIVNNDFDNTINALTNASNGSNSALRANILGANSNRTRAMSDAYFKANDINRQQDMQAQQFNLGIDQFNTQQDNQERDINARNKAAIEDRKRASRDAIFRDLGSIGREQTYDNRLQNLTGGYDAQGNYNPDNESYFDRLLALAGNNQKEQGGTLSKLFEFSEKKKNKIDEEFNKRYR